MADSITQTQALEMMMGGKRSDEQIAKDGARVTISQIDKLRNQLRQLEQAAQYVMATGTARKDDDAIWKRARKAADKLFGDMG